jgi:hypothetical protein
MDQLSLQRNLSTLENRYRELREISESRLQAGEADKALLKQQIEQLNSELADLKECAQQLDLLRFQLRQANEQIDLIQQRLGSAEQELQANSLRLDQSQEELKQSREELGLKTDNLRYLQNWRHELEYSVKNQLKLIRKTLGIRFTERARCILPKSFLC